MTLFYNRCAAPLLLAASLFLLVSCGQKGPLFLPDDAPEHTLTLPA